ncbi:class I SAM-dependent methyltransferase [Streptomyces sp. NPDC092296]|uniref:class I SAM-dependent methyltransferase n=1 Tax=Streptomyces sp. NPDC092296 TaxID=3366012 RepID=UPI0037F19850
MAYTRAEWSEHYAGGRGFQRLGDEEKGLLSEHAPAPVGGRALDVCCGTGEMAAFLASLGYTVDGVDFAEGALARARTEHAEADGVRWLCLDVEHDDLADLAADGYDLITLRLGIAFIRDRARVLRRLAARLRKGGALVVITPVVDTPEERRHIALDEDELALLTDGFEVGERFDAGGLAMLVLRGPGGSFSAEEKARPDPQAVFGAAVVVTDACGRVLLGRSTRGAGPARGGRTACLTQPSRSPRPYRPGRPGRTARRAELPHPHLGRSPLAHGSWCCAVRLSRVGRRVVDRDVGRALWAGGGPVGELVRSC